VVAALTAGLEGEFRYRALSFVRFLSLLLTAGLALLVAYRTHGAEALVVREAVPSLITLLLVLPVTLRWVRSEGLWSWTTARRVVSVGSGWLLTRGAETLLYRVDQLLLAPVVSQADLGFYYQSRYIVQLPNTFMAPATMQVALRTYSV